MFHLIQYLGGIFLGWSLGANDSANVFGTAVSSKMVKYSLAAILTAIFVIAGAFFQGQPGIKTLSEGLRHKKLESIQKFPAKRVLSLNKGVKIALVSSFAAALAVTIMTILKIPVSTSQAVVGAIIGIGIMEDNINFAGLGKVVACWIGTPIGGAFFTVIFYFFFRFLLKKWNPPVFIYDPVMSLLLIVCGCYGAYALGANNVANVSAVYVGADMMTPLQAAIFGGIAIAAGALTYSKPVMMTVGKGIVKLNAFTAFVCVLSQAVTVHIYAIIGVPVSTSQAIVGAVLGIGFIKGAHTIKYKMLANISVGWLATPFVAMFFAVIGYFVANLQYIKG